MTVKSEPMKDGEVVRRRGPQIGLVTGAAVEMAFIRTLYAAALLLAAMSLLGTFYGLQGRAGPLGVPWMMAVHVWDAPVWLALALGAQGLLTLAQWASRQLARRDRRWWLLYLVALGVSVYYNITAYYDPAVALGVPWLLAVVLIVAGDAAPELIVVRQG